MLTLPLFGLRMPPLKVGEKITYDLFVKVEGGISLEGHVGTLEVFVLEESVLRGVEVYHCRTHAKTLEWVDTVYKVDDVFDVWFRKDTYSPLKYTKSVREGTWSNEISAQLFVDEGYALYTDKRVSNRRFSIHSSNSYDIVTLLFFLRQYPYREDTLEVFWLDNFSARSIKVTYEDADAIKNDIIAPNKWLSIVNAIQHGIPIGNRKNKSYFDIAISYTKDYGSIPIEATVPTFNIQGYTIFLKGKLSAYYDPENPELYGGGEKKGVVETVTDTVGSFLDIFNNMLFRR